MQIGIYSIGDRTPDPVTGRRPTEHERLKALVATAVHAEEWGSTFSPPGNTTTSRTRSRRRPRCSRTSPFLIDHAGLPASTVLEQLDILGAEVLPVLRREFAARKAAGVPGAPTHAARVAAASVGKDGFDVNRGAASSVG
jgi:hypothetical protein